MIGLVILDERMTGQNYLDFLQNELPKQLEDVPLAARIAMYFQHDGAPSPIWTHDSSLIIIKQTPKLCPSSRCIV